MMETNGITSLEAKMLNVIAYHEYAQSNGAKPESLEHHGIFGTWLWLDEFAGDMGVTTQQIKGVLTSLKKKGFVKTSDEGTEDAAIRFTEAGFAAWQIVDDNTAD